MPCHELNVRVHFMPGSAPAEVSRLDGVPLTATTYGGNDAASSPVDDVGDVLATFEDLIPGAAYGVCWPPLSTE